MLSSFVIVIITVHTHAQMSMSLPPPLFSTCSVSCVVSCVRPRTLCYVIFLSLYLFFSFSLILSPLSGFAMYGVFLERLVGELEPLVIFWSFDIDMFEGIPRRVMIWYDMIRSSVGVSAFVPSPRGCAVPYSLLLSSYSSPSAFFDRSTYASSSLWPQAESKNIVSLRVGPI